MLPGRPLSSFFITYTHTYHKFALPKHSVYYYQARKLSNSADQLHSTILALLHYPVLHPLIRKDPLSALTRSRPPFKKLQTTIKFDQQHVDPARSI